MIGVGRKKLATALVLSVCLATLFSHSFFRNTQKTLENTKKNKIAFLIVINSWEKSHSSLLSCTRPDGLVTRYRGKGFISCIMREETTTIFN